MAARALQSTTRDDLRKKMCRQAAVPFSTAAHFILPYNPSSFCALFLRIPHDSKVSQAVSLAVFKCGQVYAG